MVIAGEEEGERKKGKEEEGKKRKERGKSSDSRLYLEGWGVAMKLYN